MSENQHSHDALVEACHEAMEISEKAQGEWFGVDPIYTPKELQPYKEIESILTAALKGAGVTI